MPEHKGLCPVLDESPVLVPANKPIARVWQHAQRSGAQVYADEKTHIYCRPESVVALLGLYQVPEDEWRYIMGKLTIMDDVANELRPKRQKGK